MSARTVIMLLLSGFCLSSCVTRTERLPYRRYAPPPENESILDELRREFGWQPSSDGQGAPFYKRAAQGITSTVSGWLRSDDAPAAMTQEEREHLRQEFEQQRQEALRRLRERQAQERAED